MIHGLTVIPVPVSSKFFFNVLTFDALIRKSLFNFVKHSRTSTNHWINALVNSDVFYESKYFHMYCNTVYEDGHPTIQ